MRNKILSTIQLIDGELDYYLDFCVRLGLDFDIPVQFVAAQSLATPYYAATAEAIQGAPMPPLQPRIDLYSSTEQKLISIVNKLKSINSDVSFDLEYGFLTEKVLADEASKDILFWTVNLRNEESFFNEVLGTLETTISKESAKPALNIPKDYIYKKPKTLLHVVSAHKGVFDISNIIELSNKLNLDVKYLVDGVTGENQIRTFIQNSPIDIKSFRGSLSFMSEENRKENIQNEIDMLNPDWISFQNFDSNVWSRLFSDVNTNNLLLNAERPIIIS